MAVGRARIFVELVTSDRKFKASREGRASHELRVLMKGAGFKAEDLSVQGSLGQHNVDGGRDGVQMQGYLAQKRMSPPRTLQ